MVGITIATIVVLMGSSGSDVQHYLTNAKARVKSTVQDKSRQKIILKEGKDLNKELKSLSKSIEQHIKELVMLHQNYHATGADFDAITERLIEDQKKAAQFILEARDHMHEQMSREEWNAVFQPAEKSGEEV